jgi:predicted RND superfamily exporter protein
MLLVGFAANVNSASPSNAAFGRLGSVIIAAAILSNLLVLPALLKVGFGGASAERARRVAT